jgi:hypothetical protein
MQMRKSKMFFSLFLSSFIALLMFGCGNKEELKIEEKLVSNEEMQNTSNKMDFYGKEHNEFLDYFAANVKFSSPQSVMSKKEVYPMVEGFNKLKGRPFGEREIGLLNDFYSKMDKAEKNGLFMGPFLPAQYCKWFPWLPYCNVPFPLPSELLTRKSTSYNKNVLDFIKAVKDIEDKVLADKVMKEDEKGFWLQYYSIARHSAAYWYNELIVKKENSVWIKRGFVDNNKDNGQIMKTIVDVTVEADAILGFIPSIRVTIKITWTWE